MRQAKAAFAAREVKLSKQQLLVQLKENKQKHVQEYEEAMSGYKSEFKQRLDKALEDAKKSLEEKYSKLLSKVESLTEEDISNQPDIITLVDSIQVRMPVPRSYEKEYDSAITMMEWEVEQFVTLTSAEFSCFVKDEWDWKEDFLGVTRLYK